MGKPSSAFWPWVIAAGAVLFGLAMLDGSCRADRKYRDAKAEYAEYRRTVESANAMSLERITSLERASAEYVAKIKTYDAEILARDATITTLRGKVVDANAVTEALRTEVQPVLDANPKVAELVASLDAGIILRDALIVEQQGQITTLTAQGIVKDQRFAVQVAISDEWKANYEREHALRVQAEGLFKLGERRVGLNKMITKVALGVGAASLIYGLLK